MTKIVSSASANLAHQAERLEKAVKTFGCVWNPADMERIRLAAKGICETIMPELGPNPYSRPTGDKRFYGILKEMADLHAKKGADYGTKEDFLSNIRASEEYGIPAWIGASLRANDKVKRIKAFIANGKLANEPLEDALIDNCCYNIIALILYREMRQKKEIADHFQK